MDELLAGCENLTLSKNAKGGMFASRRSGDKQIRIENGEHLRQAQRGAGIVWRYYNRQRQ